MSQVMSHKNSSPRVEVKNLDARCSYLPLAALLQLGILATLAASFQLSYNFHRAARLNRHGSPSADGFGLSASPPQYQEGDDVMVVDDDGATHTVGTVEQKRGGWYTICLQRDSVRVKRRGSQLQKKSGSTADGAPPQQSAIADPKDCNSEKNDELPSATTADVVDLDYILRSMEQTYSQHDNKIHNQWLNATNNNQSQFISPDTIDQIANCHSQITKWLIFSDLHVMPSTLSTCIQVLDTVHSTAIQANAGILFLGDFWHHRGFVRVDSLNAILDVMSNWTVPCIMIPGNHDQVDWRGVEHSLTPLGNSYRLSSLNGVDGDGEGQPKQYPGPLIISRPTKFLNALFIPHIRDKAMMKSILSSKEAASSSALFVHADVKGASMNDLIKSEHGLSASIFPANKLVYSGHFHKPHVVKSGKNKSSNNCNISIRYVGSPYQTSFSESGQAKSLLLVDSQRDWQCINELPIDVGPQYHRVSSVHRFLDFDGARNGDKVSVTVSQRDLDELRNEAEKSPFDVKLDELRGAGVAVEIRDDQPRYQDGMVAGIPSAESDEEIIELEDLSPKATLAAYLDNEVESGELGEISAKVLLEKGLELLGETIDAAANKSLALKVPSNEALVTELEVESVSILGFGSFRQEVLYPLRNRGVVLLRGTNKDYGSDSNGAGKSTLAMASLWALAGSVDPRPTQDGKVTDIVNDHSKSAQVTLRGYINSKPFVVKRAKGIRSKGSSLTFVLDGTDMTRQSPKDTQALINEHLGNSEILTRTVFLGQHAIGGLLESSDAKLKDELSYLVSLDVWQRSASLARLKQRELMRRASELEGMLLLREQDKARAEESANSAKEEAKRRERILESERLTLLQKEESLSSDSDSSSVETAMDSVQTKLQECTNQINGLEEGLAKCMDSNDGSEVSVLRSKLNEKAAIENEARAILQAYQRKHDVTMMEFKSAERQLSLLQSEWNADMRAKDGASRHLLSPETCRTCGQPITSSTAQKHIMETIEEKLTAAISHVDKARETKDHAALSYEEAKKEVDARGLEMQSCMTELRQAEDTLSHQTNDLREKIKEARSLQSKLSIEFASLARRAKEMSEADLVKSQMQADLNRLNEAHMASIVTFEGCLSELGIIEDNIAELEKDRETTTSAAALYASLADTFGPKGIQAFVLRNIVHALQYCSQTYLDELSDGSLQLHMEVGPNDSIIKKAAARNTDGTWRLRPLSSLSGGQWRRCSLSLSLGFIDLASKRGKIQSSLLVLDEPLTHLDSAGRKSVGRLLRKMLRQGSGIKTRGRDGFCLSTILVILQEIAAEEIEECFDKIDEVVKQRGESFVILDENGN